MDDDLTAAQKLPFELLNLTLTPWIADHLDSSSSQGHSQIVELATSSHRYFNFSITIIDTYIYERWIAYGREWDRHDKHCSAVSSRTLDDDSDKEEQERTCAYCGESSQERRAQHDFSSRAMHLHQAGYVLERLNKLKSNLQKRSGSETVQGEDA